VVVRAGVVKVPLVALAPLHPPLAVQVEALVLDQVKTEDLPEMTEVELTDILTVGVGVVGALVTVTLALAEALPPAPLHFSV
jgi:nucleoside phosphorylase